MYMSMLYEWMQVSCVKIGLGLGNYEYSKTLRKMSHICIIETHFYCDKDTDIIEKDIIYT